MSSGDITIGSEVTIHFTIKLTDNTVAETTKKGEPSVFVLTEASLDDPVEASLIGKKAGEKVRVELSAEQGYGESKESNIYDIDREKFPKDIEPTLGDIFSFERPDGAEVPGVVSHLGEKKITVDFNHPLTGKNLLVEIEILKVNPASA